MCVCGETVESAAPPAPDGEVIGIWDGSVSPLASRQRTGVRAAAAAAATASFQKS